MNRFSRAFTLIELLVVISIIAVLASVILVALNGARQKGTIGAAQEFDKSAYAGWYSDTTAAWDFDEGLVGGAVPDQSGNNNNLTLTSPTPGAVALVSNPNPLPSGKTLSVSPDATDYAQTATLNNPPTNDFSVSFWIEMTQQTGYNIISNYGGNANPQSVGTWSFSPHGTANGFVFALKSGTFPANLLAVPSLSYNQWYQIVGTCNSSNSMLGLYVNGKQANSAVLNSGSCAFASSAVYMNDQAAYTYYLDNVRIYKKPLSLSDIQERYLAELPKFRSLSVNVEH